MHLTPTVLKSLCQEYDLTPSKKYGQNYLITDAPIKKMIEAADLKKTDVVIEIGPGFGVLTFALTEQGCRVVSFEIERKLENYWEKEINDKLINDNIEIVWGNALSNLKSYVLSLKSDYKVVANIPYQITSDLLRTLLELENKPESITIMVQKEVAERICAKPRSAGSRQGGEMSLLAVSVQYYGEPKIVAKVPRGCFWPSPKVDSAVLHINIKTHGLRPKHMAFGLNTRDNDFSDEEFFRVVKAGFANKRKQLWGNISKQLSVDSNQVKQVILSVAGNEKVRAEELSVEQWKKIVKELFNNEVMK